MEVSEIEIEELQKARDNAPIELLTELQLALVGGGSGDVIIG